MSAHPFRTLYALALLALLTACATHPALIEGRRLIADGRPEEALTALENGLKEKPDDADMRQTYYRQRELWTTSTLAAADGARAARRDADATALYRRVLAREPGNPRAAEGLARLAAGTKYAKLMTEANAAFKKGERDLAEARLREILNAEPAYPEARALLARVQDENARAAAQAQALRSPFAKPVTLEFRDATLRSVFEVISRSSGLNFVFDKDVRSDAKVTLFVRDTTLDDVVKLILTTNQLERKLLNENSVLVYPDTPAKRREYQEMVVRSFYLANAEAKQAQALIRSMVKTRDIFIDEKLNLMVVRDTPDAVRLAERLIASLDIAEPEVVLDVEVLEVSRTRLLELGLKFPDQISYGLLQPTTTTQTTTAVGTTFSTNLGGQLLSGFVNTRELNASVPFVANPALVLNLKSQAGDANLLANPRIRVKSKEKAKVHIGDKLPVFTTTSTANVGVSASVNYLDVGLKLEVEPEVHLDDEVAMKVGLEVSSIAREVPGPSNSLAYQVGTRSAATVLRLRNGETQILAGLISDEERSSANRLPGLGDLPIIGRLFSSTRDTGSKTEIVLLITPHIVRNIVRPDPATLTLAAGTDASSGAPALTIRQTQPRGLALSSQGNAPPRTAPAGSPLAAAADENPPASAPGDVVALVNPQAQPQPAQALKAVLSGPQQAAPGSEFSVAVSVAAGTEVASLQADVTFDASVLTPTNATAVGGRVTIPLAPGGGGFRGELRFRVTALTATDTRVEMPAAWAFDQNGAALVVTPPPPVSIAIRP